MSYLECLSQPAPEGAELMLSDGLFNTIGALMIVSIVVAAILAPLVRSRYRARVQRLMGLNQVHPRPDGWWQARDNRGQTPDNDSAAVSVTREARIASGLDWERRVSRATVVAWLAFILVAPVILAWSNPASHWFSNLEFALGAGLLALGPAIVNLPLRWQRKALFVGLGALLLMLIVLGIIDPDLAEPIVEGEEDDLPDWAVALLLVPLGWVYISLFRHRIRGQVIPLAVVLCVFIIVFILPIGFMEPYMGTCLEAFAPGDSSTQEKAALAGTLGLIGATLSMLAIWVALRVLGLLATGIERGWLSDLSMVSLVGLAVIAASMVFGAVPDEAALVPAWVGLLPLLWMTPSLALYVLLLGRRPPQAPALPLLMLRVFSAEKKKHNLLHRIQERWRYIGAVNQAGGPDLLDLNVDPYECSKFMTGSLHELFLPEAVSGEKLMSRFEHAPDREGRYRVNEMFNFNTSWRGNVEQLIINSPTILLDVRGLTAEREGTSFEVGLLAEHGLLERVVAVGDEDTDWEHIGERLAEHGQQPEDLKRSDESEESDPSRLFGELVAVATRGP